MVCEHRCFSWYNTVTIYIPRCYQKIIWYSVNSKKVPFDYFISLNHSLKLYFCICKWPTYDLLIQFAREHHTNANKWNTSINHRADTGTLTVFVGYAVEYILKTLSVRGKQERLDQKRSIYRRSYCSSYWNTNDPRIPLRSSCYFPL